MLNRTLDNSASAVALTAREGDPTNPFRAFFPFSITVLPFLSDPDRNGGDLSPVLGVANLGIAPAVLDADGNLITPAEIDARYHANLRLLDESLIAQVPEVIQISVNTPSRQWAGEE